MAKRVDYEFVGWLIDKYGPIEQIAIVSTREVASKLRSVGFAGVEDRGRCAEVVSDEVKKKLHRTLNYTYGPMLPEFEFLSKSMVTQGARLHHMGIHVPNLAIVKQQLKLREIPYSTEYNTEDHCYVYVWNGPKSSLSPLGCPLKVIERKYVREPVNPNELGRNALELLFRETVNRSYRTWRVKTKEYGPHTQLIGGVQGRYYDLSRKYWRLVHQMRTDSVTADTIEDIANYGLMLYMAWIAVNEGWSTGGMI